MFLLKVQILILARLINLSFYEFDFIGLWLVSRGLTFSGFIELENLTMTMNNNLPLLPFPGEIISGERVIKLFC